MSKFLLCATFGLYLLQLCLAETRNSFLEDAANRQMSAVTLSGKETANAVEEEILAPQSSDAET